MSVALVQFGLAPLESQLETPHGRGVKRAVCLFLLVLGCRPSEQTQTSSSAREAAERAETAGRFVKLALDCVHRPYPNKIGHVLRSAEDLALPMEMTPAFYGCFDWHSAVHGHWMLLRWLRTGLETEASAVRTALERSLTPENMAVELAYYGPRPGFERPYGIAWYLQLASEAHEAQEEEWRKTLRPLEDAIVANVLTWLDKLAYPIRVGTHNQTAFAFGLMLDYARHVGRPELEAKLVAKSRAFYGKDRACPMAYEPSGEDFLSPCLMEADLMRRVVPPAHFSSWLSEFLPGIPKDGGESWLEPGKVLDPTDGKLVHLDGLNISRAWALEGIMSALDARDPRRPALLAAARRHREVGLASVTGDHYEGGHWLASFATYLLTERGLR